MFHLLAHASLQVQGVELERDFSGALEATALVIRKIHMQAQALWL